MHTVECQAHASAYDKQGSLDGFHSLCDLVKFKAHDEKASGGIRFENFDKGLKKLVS